jgi:hypothetical protein
MVWPFAHYSVVVDSICIHFLLEIGTFSEPLFVIHGRHTQLPWLHGRDSPRSVTDSRTEGVVRLCVCSLM